MVSGRIIKDFPQFRNGQWTKSLVPVLDFVSFIIFFVEAAIRYSGPLIEIEILDLINRGGNLLKTRNRIVIHAWHCIDLDKICIVLIAVNALLLGRMVVYHWFSFVFLSFIVLWFLSTFILLENEPGIENRWQGNQTSSMNSRSFFVNQIDFDMYFFRQNPSRVDFKKKADRITHSDQLRQPKQ